jgi:hypothetical protein
MNQAVDSYWRAYSERGLLPPHLQGVAEGSPVTPYLEAWHDRSSELYLVGRLDACIRNPVGFFVPVDHKWKGSPPEAVDDAYVLQLDAYDLLLEKNGYPAAGFGILDYYVPLGETVDTNIHLETTIRRVETSGERALSWMLRARDVLELTEVPDASPDCEYCFWASWVGHPSSSSAH